MLQQPAILKALATKKAYTSHAEKLVKHPLSPEGKWVLDNYKSWYESKDKDIDFNVFPDYCFAVRHPNMSTDKQELYSVIIQNIISADDSVADDIISNWCRDDRVLDINYSIESYLDGTGTIDSVTQTIREAGELDAVEATDDVLTIDNVTFGKEDLERLKWNLGCLNDCTAGIGGGNLAIVFASSNVGKSSFVISEVVNFIPQIPDDKYIIWFNNEEELKLLYARHVSCVAGKKTSEIKENWDAYSKGFVKHFGDKIVGIDSGNITRGKVTSILDKYPPAVVVFNNLDKIQKGNDMAMHKELGALYQWGRELAKDYNTAVIAVCQASDNAAGKSMLTQNMMQDSRVDKCGEADIIIGIGRAALEEGQTEEVRDETGNVFRYINVCKNKLDEGTIEGKRESYLNMVKLNTSTGKYSDITKQEFN